MTAGPISSNRLYTAVFFSFQYYDCRKEKQHENHIQAVDFASLADRDHGLRWNRPYPLVSDRKLHTTGAARNEVICCPFRQADLRLPRRLLECSDRVIIEGRARTYPVHFVHSVHSSTILCSVDANR